MTINIQSVISVGKSESVYSSLNSVSQVKINVTTVTNSRVLPCRRSLASSFSRTVTKCMERVTLLLVAFLPVTSPDVD